jgi:hypothetical protein
MGKCIDSIELGDNQMITSTSTEKTVYTLGESGTLDFTLMKSDLLDIMTSNPSVTYPVYTQVREKVADFCLDVHIRIIIKMNKYALK